MDPIVLFMLLAAPGGGTFLASWAALMVRYRSSREPVPGGALLPRFRRVVFGKYLMTAMILASYTCGLIIGPLLLANTATCREAEFGF